MQWFIIDEDKRVQDLGQSRLMELLDLLGEIGNKPVVIWTQFRHEAMQIVKALKGVETTIMGSETCDSEPFAHRRSGRRHCEPIR